MTSASHVTPPVSYVDAYSNGQPGSASDQTCDKLAGAANNDYDTAQTLLDGGDNPSTWALLNTVKALQDYAENIGCVVINQYDVYRTPRAPRVPWRVARRLTAGSCSRYGRWMSSPPLR